jgi:hypothetical protein
MAELLLYHRRSRTAGVFENVLLLAFVAGFAFLPVYLSRHPEYAGAAEVSVSVLLLPVVPVAGMILAWRVLGHEQVSLDGESLRATRQVGPFRRTASVALAEIVDVRTSPVGRRELQSNFLGTGHPSVVVEGSQSRIRCGIALSPEQANDLTRRIQAAVEAGRRRTRS